MHVYKALLFFFFCDGEKYILKVPAYGASATSCWCFVTVVFVCLRHSLVQFHISLSED